VELAAESDLAHLGRVGSSGSQGVPVFAFGRGPRKEKSVRARVFGAKARLMKLDLAEAATSPTTSGSFGRARNA
jgi:hypothetical protein